MPTLHKTRAVVLTIAFLAAVLCPGFAGESRAQKAGAADFQVRGLEIHSSRMWRWSAIETTLSVMEKLQLNCLIFHQVDLVDQLVLPRAYFSSDLMWQRWPVRLHTADNNKQYIRRVIEEGRRRNIRFFLEVKEIWYPDGLLELHPELIQANGAVCPTNPFWWKFVRDKYRELVEEVPDLAGVIVSPASRESRVSMVANACKCDRCRTYRVADWYENLFRAMYEPLQAKGKTLVVRDFAYRRSEQDIVIDSTGRVANDIVIALKYTPHDFYPTFPNNPRIGNVGTHPQWIEFDVWGQFTGMGLFPCGLAEDMQKRIDYCHRQKAAGAWFRTDWEGMSEGSVFNSPNMLNLFAGSMLALNKSEPLESIYDAWLRHGLEDPLQSDSTPRRPVAIKPEDRPRWTEFMKASLPIIEKTLFVRGHLFHEDGMFPDTVKRAFDMMTQLHGRDDWEPGASKRVEATDENIRAVVAEKEQAEREAAGLPEILRIGEQDVPQGFKTDMRNLLGLYLHYVRGFRYTAEACFRARKAMSTRDAADIKAALASADAVQAYRADTARRLASTSYPHYVYWFFDVQRLDRLTADIREKVSPLAGSRSAP